MIIDDNTLRFMSNIHCSFISYVVLYSYLRKKWHRHVHDHLVTEIRLSDLVVVVPKTTS